ncbi:MerR family transcriptional regulator [Streptomyces sp. TLI_171]|uniref:MerR family transcriptional regulator n=1 Tax=Streptomyces sp. TLI_171 TaxID=1938859 RepID=UPI000C19A015|nr:MerR family transcriptional regulator [Streptomyces sp. TLI_171]RKE18468.1 B12 binding protein [Streptomyces sp. TLI_171]
MPEPALSTGAVARRLGVSPTTVRSWERRYGIGPAEREAGRHRLWAEPDVAVLEAMCRLTARGVSPAEAARLARSGAAAGAASTVAAQAPAVRPEVRGLARAARRLDGPEVARILRDGVERFGAVAAWTDLMAPALRAAGRRWAAGGGERYVEVEHLLSWHVSGALRRVAEPGAGPGSAPPAAGPPVLLAAMPGEQHTLPLEAVAAALAELGLPYRMFGPALPADALAGAVRRTGPAAVLLWSQTRATADPAPARAVPAAARGGRGARTRPALLTAGPGWTAATRPPDALMPRDLPGALALLAGALGSRTW